MGHKSKVTLNQQIYDTFQSMEGFGRSKHQDKKDGVSDRFIYSFSTMKSYIKHANYFTDFCKRDPRIREELGHRPRTLAECRPYVERFLREREGTCSPYTVKLELSALQKLYGEKMDIRTASICRDDITRSRGEKIRDAHFSEERNKPFVDFCRSTGLRREEVTQLTGDKLIERDGKYYVVVDAGSKGGRYREAPVIGNIENVVTLMRSAGSGRVFEKVPSGADIHSYRSDYATAIYKMYARPLEDCKADRNFYNPEHHNGKGKPKGGYDRDAVYRLRGSHKGEWMDKRAMMEASKALGHNRISVVGEHYIR